METEIEDFDNIKDICYQIFNNAPKPKKTIVLELEEYCQKEETIFDIMLLMANYGMKFLFNKVDPLDLTQQEFKLLNRYFESFGMRIIFSSESYDDRDFLVERPDQLVSLLEAGYSFLNYKISFEFV
jgi:hypothetical protein